MHLAKLLAREALILDGDPGGVWLLTIERRTGVLKCILGDDTYLGCLIGEAEQLFFDNLLLLPEL